MSLSIKTAIKALNMAALNRKSAFQIELAVGLAMYMMDTLPSYQAKRALCGAYNSAGYQCLVSTDIDYKTINRRINATADLFNIITLRTLRKWVGTRTEGHAIEAIVAGLAPYELLTVSDVLRYCHPLVKSFGVARRVEVKPDTAILNGPTTGQDAVINMFRRAADQGKRVTTEHLALTIPDKVDSKELIEMAYQLLRMSKELEVA